MFRTQAVKFAKLWEVLKDVTKSNNIYCLSNNLLASIDK